MLASVCPIPVVAPDASVFAADPDAKVTAEADRIDTDEDTVILEGDTVIEYLGRKLSAENALYNQKTGELTVNGPMSFLGDGIQLESNDAYLNLENEQFSTGQTEYELNLNGNRAVGSASAMEGLPNGDFTLEGATYSTCPPGDRSWYIKADSLELFPEEGIGKARNLKLVFKGVPILAVPAFSFPISDKRKTGFLAPAIGRGENTGLELEIPWYWNVRPNFDATFTPRFLSKRGVQLQSELRYLNRQGIWQLDHEYLKDSERNDQTRHFTQLRHSGRFNRQFTSEVSASRVSDRDYLDDLGNSLELASITHLEQRADIRFDDGNVQALARLQGFQTVDEAIAPADRPHERLPQLRLDATSGRLPLGLRTDLSSEFVFFDKDDDITGTRVDFMPRVSIPVIRDAWFFRPSASYRFTHYSLNNTGDTISADSSRNTTSLSVDSGLFFDRLLDDKGTIQTLEPRVFYLRVPFVDQDNIAVFDSSEFDFNISQLFRDNRFSGADRVADADQVSLALTTRIISGTDGRELFSASVGQIRYFKDRRIQLPVDAGVETRSTSDFVAEFDTRLARSWIAKGNIQYNGADKETVRGSLSLSYRPDQDHIANITHRIVDDDLNQRTEQIDLSGLWRINDEWRIAGRYNYSLDANTSIESLLGLEYDSCCWAVRFAARRFISDDGEDHDISVYFQLVLKGLAPLGQDYGELIENAVAGYKDTL